MKTTKTKRLLAACLALMLTIGLLATGVFAAKNTTVSDVKEKIGSDGQIVVTVYDQDPGAAGTGAQVSSGLSNPVDGVGINALRIGSVVELTTSTTDSSAEPATTTVKTQVAFGLTEDMAGLVGLDTKNAIASQNDSSGTRIFYFAPTAVQNALSAKNATADGQTAIESTLNDNKSKRTEVTGESPDAKGVATFSNLDCGLYLLAKSKLPDNATTDLVPFLVSVPMYVQTTDDGTTGATGTWNHTVYAYPKVRTGNVTIEKAVDDADKYVNAGQTLKYTVTTTIPASRSAAGTGSAMPFTSFVITDTNTDSTLDINETTIEVKLGNSKTLTKGTQYTVTYEDGVLSITLTKTATTGGLAELNKGLATEQTITVTYDATVATDVNFSTKLTNTATATYQRESMAAQAEAKIAENKSNKVDLYTYGLDLTKTLSKVEDNIGDNIISFALYTNEDCTEGKIPVVSGEGGYWVAAEEEATPVVMYISSGANSGTLNLYGLEPGIYYLKELTTQSGYTLLAEPIKIEITAPAIAGDPATAKVNEATAQVAEGVVYLQVENTKNEDGFNLPQTGGTGTLLVTAIGLGLLCAGVVLLVAYRKKSHG